MATKQVQNQVIVALLIVVVGGLLLLETTGTYDTGPLWLWFPSLFILVALWAMVQMRFRSMVGPGVVLVVAGVAQLGNLGLLGWSDVGRWWPLLIIAVGLSVLWGVLRHQAVTDDAGATVDLFAFFGGNDRHLTSPAFRGGAATAMFGAVRMDLKDAVLEHRPAELSVNAMFGGVELKVPDTWNVVLNVVPLFGGAGDERVRKPRGTGGEPADLVVNGFAAFGGVTVKD